MTEILQQPLFGVFITLLAFKIAMIIKAKVKSVLFNPVLISIILIIGFLSVFKIEFKDYNVGGQYLSFLLGPSVVALGVLFYEKYEQIKSNIGPFLVSILAGGILSMVSVVLIAFFMGAPEVILKSIVSKSVTTPIAIEITKGLGGIPSIAAGVVIAVGIFGNAFGPSILKFLGITDKLAIGTALGTAAHGIGTARALEEGKLPGAYSGLAMCINGFLTAVIAPYFIMWILKL